MMKTLFWASTAICAVIMTLLICHNRHVGYYEAVAVIRPIMEVQDNDTNACYWSKTLLAAEDIDGLRFYETHDKQISLHLYMHDSVAALDNMVLAIDFATKRFTKKGIRSIITEAPHIAQAPHHQQHILYAVLSFIFSLMSIGAIAIIRNISKKGTI